jgi:hypothetical protein
MAELVCPVEGYGDVALIVPDKFLVKHHDAWSRGVRKAELLFGSTVSAGSEWFCGSLELCEVKNPPAASPDEWPLELFNWVVDEVYIKRFKPVLTPQKKT